MQQGISLLNALRHAKALGVLVEHVRKTGELRLTHPLIPQRLRCNSRRKDASRQTVGFLRKVAALQATNNRWLATDAIPMKGWRELMPVNNPYGKEKLRDELDRRR